MLDDNVKIIYKPAQLESIKDLVDKRLADGSLHPDTLDDRLGEIGLSIQSEEFATKLQNIESLSKIRSNVLQDIIDRLYIDILALYKSIERAENTFNFKNRKIQQQVSASRDICLKVKSNVKSYIAGFKNPEYDRIIQISFNDKSNATNEDNSAVVSNRSPKLKLQGDHSIINNDVNIIPSFSIAANMYSTEGDINNVIDLNPNTYYQTTVVSEALVPSLTAQIVLKMSSIKVISSISILPYCPYPQTISSLEYSIDGTIWFPIPSFDPAIATQNTDYVTIDFSGVQAKLFRITLVQSNSIYRDKLIPENNQDTTKEIISDRILHNISQVDFTNYDKRSETIQNDLTTAIINSIIYSSDILTRVNGYEYVFGIADILLVSSSYAQSSSYISRPFANSNNAFALELNVNELKQPDTAIEYSINLGDNISIPILPRSNNLLVESELLQFAGDSLTAITRFTLDMPRGVNVFRNGVELTPNEFTFSNNSITILNAGYTQPLDNSSFYTASYYSIGGNIVNIFDVTNSTSFEESFNTTANNGEIKLTYHPHIEYGVINDLKNFYYDSGKYIYSGDPDTLLAFSIDNPNERLKVNESSISSLINILYLDGIPYGNISSTNRTYIPIRVLVDDQEARNITNYIGDNQSALSQNPIGQTNYDYINTGNRIVFGTPIVGKTIKIQYNVLAKHIQMESVLRRTSVNDSSVTPVIKDATLLIKARNK